MQWSLFFLCSGMFFLLSCHLSKTCPQPCCFHDAECANFCSGGRCFCDQGFCRQVTCLKEQDCLPGEICLSYKCVRGDFCTQDSECFSSQVCSDGKCVERGNPGCLQDGDCETPKICCDFGNGTGIKCNLGRCVGDKDCDASTSKNTCIKPIACVEGRPSCFGGRCVCR